MASAESQLAGALEKHLLNLCFQCNELESTVLFLRLLIHSPTKIRQKEAFIDDPIGSFDDIQPIINHHARPLTSIRCKKYKLHYVLDGVELEVTLESNVFAISPPYTHQTIVYSTHG